MLENLYFDTIKNLHRVQISTLVLILPIIFCIFYFYLPVTLNIRAMLLNNYYTNEIIATIRYNYYAKEQK